VAACTRPADGACGYCNTHDQRWRVACRVNPGLDPRSFQVRESGVAEPGQVNLRALPPLVVVEVLFGAQGRTQAGGKLSDRDLRPLCDLARREQASSLEELKADRVPNNTSRKLLRAFARDIRRALADPGAEQAKDTWDLAVFGHPGRLAFARITQPWLRQAAKAWAADDLPRHRGKGAAKVQEKVHALAELSASLRCREDHGDLPPALGRPDIEDFLNRLAYLESTGKISRYHRNVVCRGTRLVLSGIRGLGITRAGEAAAGLPDVFVIGPGDIPDDPERAEAGRDLPPEVMAVLCANLDSLEPAEVRVAVQVAIDTGRRPEEIRSLPLECLAAGKDGGTVLVYDNKKANRFGRRLPISEATTAVITAQQERVRGRFPGIPRSELKLLPAPRRNPDGRTAISIDMLEARHHDWVASLGPLVASDGVELGPDRVVPYCYRHSYAQRHADAGVPLDLLADLLDQRNLNITRRYYRIGEDRRRGAVERVAALSFDRHGKRVWAQAEALLESEHARYAMGEVAVPYGACTEPSNAKAGGHACPFRFRCVGCGHFRTDVSYLPDLQAYLDDLLRNRERVLAAPGLDSWALAEAMPSEDEVARVRRLIAHVRAGLEGLSPEERAQVDDAVAAVRRHRSATLGIGPPLQSFPPLLE
jgi:integrase